eukprot:9375446-Alexandrium_andersonii.AAC.1
MCIRDSTFFEPEENSSWSLSGGLPPPRPPRLAPPARAASSGGLPPPRTHPTGAPETPVGG